MVLSRLQGDKKVSSLPFTLWVTANGGTTSVRMGVDVPIGNSTVTTGQAIPTGPAGGPTGSRTTSQTDSKIEYRNVGTSIDSRGSRPRTTAGITVYVNVLDSSIFTTDTDASPR